MDWDGNFHYPLIGKVQVKGLTLPQIEAKIAKAMREYVHDPPSDGFSLRNLPWPGSWSLAQVLGSIKGTKRFLIMGTDYETTPENVYDKVCVIRRKQAQWFHDVHRCGYGAHVQAL